MRGLRQNALPSFASALPLLGLQAQLGQPGRPRQIALLSFCAQPPLLLAVRYGRPFAPPARRRTGRETNMNVSDIWTRIWPLTWHRPCSRTVSDSLSAAFEPFAAGALPAPPAFASRCAFFPPSSPSSSCFMEPSLVSSSPKRSMRFSFASISSTGMPHRCARALRFSSSAMSSALRVSSSSDAGAASVASAAAPAGVAAFTEEGAGDAAGLAVAEGAG